MLNSSRPSGTATRLKPQTGDDALAQSMFHISGARQVPFHRDRPGTWLADFHNHALAALESFRAYEAEGGGDELAAAGSNSRRMHQTVTAGRLAEDRAGTANLMLGLVTRTAALERDVLGQVIDASEQAATIQVVLADLRRRLSEHGPRSRREGLAAIHSIGGQR